MLPFSWTRIPWTRGQYLVGCSSIFSCRSLVGPDDRIALEFVVQISANPRMRGTVVRITICDVEDIAVLPIYINNESESMETSTVSSVCRSYILVLVSYHSIIGPENHWKV